MKSKREFAIVGGILCAIIGGLMVWHPPADKGVYGAFLVVLALAAVAFFSEK